MRFPLILRAWHDATVARLVAERDQLAKDLAAAEAELAGVSEKWTDTAIVNDCLTEDLTKLRKQLADSMAVEESLAAQIHVLVGHDLPPEAGLNPMADVIRERDAEKRRADRLQRQLDDATFLPPGRVEDSGRWQPGYQQPKPTKENAS
ncbi:hypothetical protein [Streptomyces stelliscabiei]|uniref:hypothetical protein n=1 Tax=Streptomyces stelliscabiei TaxID=146820 RepID=UPI0029B8E0B4|nr:hypothetical protein [Streptomyces stelliscabiei]MDX2550184.1 hypothetical protein [Streptomyces stelliscabiei]